MPFDIAPEYVATGVCLLGLIPITFKFWKEGTKSRFSRISCLLTEFCYFITLFIGCGFFSLQNYIAIPFIIGLIGTMIILYHTMCYDNIIVKKERDIIFEQFENEDE